MTYEELVKMRQELALEAAVEYSPDAAADALLMQLAESWDETPNDLRAVCMGVSTSLKKHGAQEVWSDLQAKAIVQDLRRDHD